MLATASSSMHLGERAARRLLADCVTLTWLVEPPPPSARQRLERVVGDPLANRLVSALSGDHRMRGLERLA
jgi:hypothetical protein